VHHAENFILCVHIIIKIYRKDIDTQSGNLDLNLEIKMWREEEKKYYKIQNKIYKNVNFIHTCKIKIYL
jgi:hypothetical protein